MARANRLARATTIITQALTGDCIRLGNLDARRDFTYVRDTVNGFLLAADASGRLGQEINLGTGADISIGDLTAEIVRQVGRPVQIRPSWSGCAPKVRGVVVIR